MEKKAYEEEGNDEAEEADGRAEDLNDDDLHEERAVGGVGDGRAAADNAHADAARQIRDAKRDARPERGVAWRTREQQLDDEHSKAN